MSNNLTNINRPKLSKRYTFIIPSAGLGTRMKGMGPKCLIEINGKTLLERQIAAIADNFRRFQIVLVCGFEADIVKSQIRRTRNLDIVVNNKYEDTNVVESIRLGLENRNTDDVIIMSGDLLFSKNALSAPFGHRSCLILDKEGGRMKKQEVGVVEVNHCATNLMYGLPKKWAQIAYLCNKELDMAKELMKSPEVAKWFTFELINKIIDNGGNFSTYSPKNIKITDLDSPPEIRAAAELKW